MDILTTDGSFSVRLFMCGRQPNARLAAGADRRRRKGDVFTEFVDCDGLVLRLRSDEIRSIERVDEQPNT